MIWRERAFKVNPVRLGKAGIFKGQWRGQCFWSYIRRAGSSNGSVQRGNRKPDPIRIEKSLQGLWIIHREGGC